MSDKLRVIISGGGTGGHIFPAISIANALREKRPDCEILFVGAEGRMEMQRVPAAGYEIKGLPVAGFDRKNLLKNVPVLWKLFKSRRLARQIVRDFAPDVAIGVGGYASGPTIEAAQSLGIPTLLQEQNSFAGVTNKLLAKRARRICVAYKGMERFFSGRKHSVDRKSHSPETIGAECRQKCRPADVRSGAGQKHRAHCGWFAGSPHAQRECVGKPEPHSPTGQGAIHLANREIL